MKIDACQQFCTFYLGQYYFGITVELVQEIIRFQPITPVALAPKAVAGLINLRGQIVTAIDLRVLLGMPVRNDDESQMNIVVQTDDGVFSLLVDRIGDSLKLDDSLSELPPANVVGIAKELIKNAYMLDESLLLTMNVNELVSMDFLSVSNTR